MTKDMFKLLNRNNEEVMVVGVNGVARAGKDTVANFLVELENDFIIDKFSFADPLKEAASAMFSIPLNCFYDKEEKDAIDPFWGITRREITQKVGTECGRNVFFDDLWIRNLQKRVEESDVRIAVVADVRFNNEAEWVNNINNSIMVNISNKNIEHSKELYQHVSENGINKDYIDYKIKNDFGIDELKEAVTNLLIQINKKIA